MNDTYSISVKDISKPVPEVKINKQCIVVVLDDKLLAFDQLWQPQHNINNNCKYTGYTISELAIIDDTVDN